MRFGARITGKNEYVYEDGKRITLTLNLEAGGTLAYETANEDEATQWNFGDEVILTASKKGEA